MKITRFDEFSETLARLYTRCRELETYDERTIYHTEHRAAIQPYLDTLEDIQRENLTPSGGIRRQLLTPHVLESVAAITLYRNTAYSGQTVTREYLDSMVQTGRALDDLEPEDAAFWTETLKDFEPEKKFRIRASSVDYRSLAYNNRTTAPERFTLRRAGVICIGTVPTVRIMPPSPRDRADRYHETHLPLYVGRLYGWNVYRVLTE